MIQKGFCFEINNLCIVIKKDGLYDDKHINNKRLKSSQSDETLLWHYSHGHVNKKHMKELQQTNLLDSFGDIAIRSCEFSLKGKMTKSPFNMKGERAKDLLELIHSYVCGPIS